MPGGAHSGIRLRGQGDAHCKGNDIVPFLLTGQHHQPDSAVNSRQFEGCCERSLWVDGLWWGRRCRRHRRGEGGRQVARRHLAVLPHGSFVVLQHADTPQVLQLLHLDQELIAFIRSGL